MAEWLFKEDNYVPQEDKDSFLDKSIRSILGTMSKIKRNNENSYIKNIYIINPIVKVFFTLLMIVFISLSRNFLFLLMVNIYVLAILSFLKRDEIIKVMGIMVTALIFTLVMLLPAMVTGNWLNSLLIAYKVLCTVMLVDILSYSTKWNQISRVFKLFFIPDLFILVLEITIRYIYLLGDFSLSMLYALKLRSIGKNNNKYTSMSQIMGTLFLKSKEMGDEVYASMECRGFTGEYSAYSKFKFVKQDYAYIISNVIIVAAYFVFIRM